MSTTDLDTADIWGRTVTSGGICLVPCKSLSNIPGVYTRDVRSTTFICDKYKIKKSYGDTITCFLGEQNCPSEDHGTRGGDYELT